MSVHVFLCATGEGDTSVHVNTTAIDMRAVDATTRQCTDLPEIARCYNT